MYYILYCIYIYVIYGAEVYFLQYYILFLVSPGMALPSQPISSPQKKNNCNHPRSAAKAIPKTQPVPLNGGEAPKAGKRAKAKAKSSAAKRPRKSE